jgi:dienelactone hydrolase
MSFDDHPVLIPTPEGPVGGVVTQPRGEVRARMVLYSGYGRPARSGTNSFWTRLARSLAGLGIVVLRTDWVREGETLPVGEGEKGFLARRDLDLRLQDDHVLPWFFERAGALPTFFAGACGGARFSIELAGRNPTRVGGVFLIAPDPRDFDAELAGEDPNPIDWLVVRRLRAILERTSAWIVQGDGDFADISLLKTRLGPPAAERLEVELVPDVALHFLDQPDIQEQAASRLRSRVIRALEQHRQSRSMS